jgi:preprotein translocase subunit YajC
MLGTLLTIIAQTNQGAGGGQQAPAPGFSSMLPMLLLMGLVFYLLLIRPQSKERKRRQAMLSALKKNDRVVTIGGIVGTVLSVRDDEVTLKVDESSNTKITFTRGAIQSVTSGAERTEAAGGEKDQK